MAIQQRNVNLIKHQIKIIITKVLARNRINKEIKTKVIATKAKGGQNNQGSKSKEIGLIEYYDDTEYLGDDMDYEDIRPYTERTIDMLEVSLISNSNIHEKILNPTIRENYIDKNESIDEWFYDTGAPEHIVNNKNMLIDFQEKHIQLKCANGSLCNFEGYGTYEFYLKNKIYKLDHVLYSSKINKKPN